MRAIKDPTPRSINNVKSKIYKQPTNALQFYDVLSFMIRSSTCFGQKSGHLQGVDTRIQSYLNVSKSPHKISFKILLLNNNLK